MAEGEHCPLPYPAQHFTAAGTDPLGLPEASPGSSEEKALASTQELPPGSECTVDSPGTVSTATPEYLSGRGSNNP